MCDGYLGLYVMAKYVLVLKVSPMGCMHAELALWKSTGCS